MLYAEIYSNMKPSCVSCQFMTATDSIWLCWRSYRVTQRFILRTENPNTGIYELIFINFILEQFITFGTHLCLQKMDTVSVPFRVCKK